MSESDLARIGSMEFQVLCDVLYKVVGGYDGCEHIMKALDVNNNETFVNEEEPNSDIESDMEDDYIPEPPDEEYESDDDAMKLTNVIF